jgi:hypothetical protein
VNPRSTLRHALIALVMCASTAYGQNAQRDISSCQKSLLGHWVTESGSMHFFFADGKLTTVANDGSKMDLTYTVLESNDKERWLRIRILATSGKGHDRNLVFSPDSTALVSTIKDFEETSYSMPFRWKYVDSKQAPPDAAGSGAGAAAATAARDKDFKDSQDAYAAYNRGDYATALKLWTPLAEHGNFSSSAQYFLGNMYEHGRGVPQNYAEAVKWYRKSAEQDDETSQNILGEMYRDGQGVPQDYVQAHMWFSLAASKGLQIAASNRDRVAKMMTPDQLAQAQRMAREWKPKPAQ